MAGNDIIAAVEDLDEAGGAIEFALEVGIVRQIKVNAQGVETGIGYAYTMSPLIEPDAASDVLAGLEARVQKALPAPAQATIALESSDNKPVKPTKK